MFVYVFASIRIYQDINVSKCPMVDELGPFGSHIDGFIMSGDGETVRGVWSSRRARVITNKQNR